LFIVLKIIQLGAKIGLEGGLGLGNAGDTAVSAACTNVYKKEFPNSEITYMNCRKIFDQNDVNQINSHDVLFVSGGGLFLRDTFPNSVSDWQWGISPELMEKIEIPIVVYGIGYNKFPGQPDFAPIFDKSVSKLVEKSIFFSMRNSGSCDAVKKHIPNHLHSNISQNFCPTILFKNSLNLNESRSNSVGFLLAGDRLSNRHLDLKEFILNIKKFHNYLKSNGIKTILINHQNDTWISEYIDFDETKDLFKQPVEEIYSFYSSIDTVVADRGHGQMIPFACGCKVLSPISHQKLAWFLNDLNLTDFYVSEHDKELGKVLIKKFQFIQTLDWKQIYEERIEQIQTNYNTNMNIIKSKLKKN
jgi:polysaccharide pyruvyl transferase WcaK-like protein